MRIGRALLAITAAFAISLIGTVSLADTRPPRVFLSAKLATPNGYKLLVGGFRGEVTVSALGPKSYVTYNAPGTSAPPTLAASLGQFASVDLRFEPTGPRRHPHLPEGCTGPYSLQRGVFHGTLDFHPEGGLAGVSATELKGSLTRERVHCRPPPDDPTPHSPSGHAAVFLDAYTSYGPYGTYFSATHRKGSQRVSFDVSVGRRIGDVDASYYTSTTARRSAFTYDLRAHTGTAAPPDPFSGTATLADRMWTGDLAVALPGIGSVPLTGSDFDTDLVRGSVVTIKVGRAAPAAALGLPPDLSR